MWLLSFTGKHFPAFQQSGQGAHLNTDNVPNANTLMKNLFPCYESLTLHTSNHSPLAERTFLTAETSSSIVSQQPVDIACHTEMVMDQGLRGQSFKVLSSRPDDVIGNAVCENEVCLCPVSSSGVFLLQTVNAAVRIMHAN